MSIPLRADAYAEERFQCDTQALASARRFVAKTLEAIPEALLDAVTLALDEALANVIDHGRVPPRGLIEVRVHADAHHVRLVVTHDGIPFDLEAWPEVDLEAHRRTFRTRGLGVHLIRQLMDLFLARTTRAGRQELVMVKSWS
jgi:anti-sigma regulatory factor (Ser/Thr protein kinase)